MKRQDILVIISPLREEWEMHACVGIRAFLKEHGLFFDGHVSSVEIATIADVFETNLLYEKSFAVIITVGVERSVQYQQWSSQRNITIPHIFCGVKDPDKFGLTDIPGVEGVGHEYETQVETLLALKEDVKRIGLLQTHRSIAKDAVDSDREHLVETFHKHNIEVETLEVDSVDDAENKPDVICVLRDILYSDRLPHLIAYCNKNDVTLYTSELASVYKGAALGFGDNGYEYGYEAGKIAYQIVVEGVDPKTIPVTKLYRPGELKINNQVVGRQGLHFGKRTTYLIEGRFSR